MCSLLRVFATAYFKRVKTNKAVLAGLKEDTLWSESLLQACHDDHKKGRGGMPRLVQEVDLEQASNSFLVILLRQGQHMNLRR